LWHLSCIKAGIFSRAKEGIVTSILLSGLVFNALKIGELCAKKEKPEEDLVRS